MVHSGRAGPLLSPEPLLKHAATCYNACLKAKHWEWIACSLQQKHGAHCEHCAQDVSVQGVLFVQVKVTTVVGKPIELPKVAQPSKEQIQEYLDEFIAQMQGLFERHKASAGYPDLQLVVI